MQSLLLVGRLIECHYFGVVIPMIAILTVAVQA